MGSRLPDQEDTRAHRADEEQIRQAIDFDVNESGAVRGAPRENSDRAASEGRTDGAANSAVINMTASGEHEESRLGRSDSPHAL
jgi:hypothetical protein